MTSFIWNPSFNSSIIFFTSIGIATLKIFTTTKARPPNKIFLICGFKYLPIRSNRNFAMFALVGDSINVFLALNNS